jgi:pyruvate,orthophosphate dikinase
VLDERLPEVAAELRRYAAVLERHYADMCDIEFTVEDGRLWMLQVRVGKRSPRAALRMAIDMALDDAFPLSRADAVRRVGSQLADPPRIFVREPTAQPPIATGLPASPGVATGSVVTSSDAAETAAAAGESVILVRSETSPEDVGGMARAVGVLTARGGLASHAAVVARGWGIPAVVGASAVQPSPDQVEIDGRVVKVGERITIDGGTGEIHLGELPGRWEVAPEAATLLSWAEDLDVTVSPGDGSAVGPNEAAAADAPRPDDRSIGDVGRLDVIRALSVKGTVALDALADVLLAEVDPVRSLVEGLIEERLAEGTAGTVRLTAEGKLEASGQFATDRTQLGETPAAETLDAFHAFDARMKELVTAWQVRDVAGEQVLNDHTDEAYDAQVVDDLAALHRDTVEWLSPLAGAMRPYAAYRSRLTRALDLVRAGDPRYVASPRVDSYHSVWFELHEDLIRLAGRRRADEGAAGRA